MKRSVYPLFFLSGASGLIYQIIWVRAFGLSFGNTVFSVSLVTAVFMCGLGLGSYLVGAWSDRNHAAQPALALRAYGVFELGIGILGLAISFLLPLLQDLAPILSSYVVAADGLHELSASAKLARYAIAIVLLAPITTLMGGTLNLLIRHLVSGSLDKAGFRVGLLYGVNTLGAALGCFATDWVLVPQVGLQVTQLVAVLFNLIAALGAFRIAKMSTDVETPKPAAPPAQAVEVRTFSSLVACIGAAIFFSGFAGMAFEIVWFRYLTAFLGAYRSVFSLLLTVVLLGIWIGSMLAGWLHRRFGRPTLMFLCSQALLLVVGPYCLLRLGLRSAPVESGLTPWALAWVQLRYNLTPIIAMTFVPSILLGFAYPLANAAIQSAEAAIGRRAGLLYLANTAGAVVGSVATGFVLLPSIGIQRSVLVALVAVFASIVSLFLASRLAGAPSTERKGVTPAFSGAALVFAATAVVWSSADPAMMIKKTLRSVPETSKILDVTEGINETVAIVDHAPNSNGGIDSDMRLMTNGHSMSGTAWSSQRYMRAFVHIPMLMMEHPEQVLVICFGVGNTANAATLHSTVTQVEVSDLSRNVLEHAHFFHRTNGDVLKQPMVSAFINDGRNHILMQPEHKYDLITLEPPPPTMAGVASLYSYDFYEIAKTRLKPGGYFSQWLPIDEMPERTARAMVRAFVDAFPQSVLLAGERSELILLGTTGPKMEIDPIAFAKRLESEPRVRADLDHVFLGTLTEIIGTFVASADVMREETEDVEPVTDDNPMMEYGVSAYYWNDRLPRSMFQPFGVKSWWPGYNDSNDPPVAYLRTYLAIMDRLYKHPGLLEAAANTPMPSGLNIPANDKTTPTVAASPYLQKLFNSTTATAAKAAP